MTRCWLCHDWEGWELYDVATVIMERGREEIVQGVKTRQRRRCRRCGLMETRDT
jgi:hypothetical protein